MSPVRPMRPMRAPPPGARRTPVTPVTRRLALVLALTLVSLAGARRVHADATMGLFAPAAPFSNMQARIDAAASLAEHLRAAVGVGVIRTKVFARAQDFDDAVRAGRIDFALVDATYLAKARSKAQAGARVIATTAETSWRLVSTAKTPTFAQLRGKRLLLAAGGSEAEVADGLFGGEAAQLFGIVSSAPDSASALAALALGKADAVLVPRRAPVDGLVEVTVFDPVPGLLLVTYPSATQWSARLLELAESYAGPAPLDALHRASGQEVQQLRQRLTVAPRRGPMVSLPLSSLVKGLLSASPLVIEPRAVLDFIAPLDPPGALAAPAPAPAAPAAPPPAAPAAAVK